MNSEQRKQIGEILCEKGYLNQAQLDHGVTEQQKYENRRLGRILIDLGYITQAQLEKALVLQAVPYSQETA